MRRAEPSAISHQPSAISFQLDNGAMVTQTTFT
jgi:hypothetical protein